MTGRSMGSRLLDALNQLEQYQPSRDNPEKAVCALSGAVATAVPDDDGEDHGLLSVQFPGGEPITMNGTIYLRLKAIESVRLERDSAENGEGTVSERVRDLLEHLERKHELFD